MRSYYQQYLHTKRLQALESQPKFRITDLPAELRMKIWEFAISNQRQLFPRAARDGPDKRKNMSKSRRAQRAAAQYKGSWAQDLMCGVGNKFKKEVALAALENCEFIVTALHDLYYLLYRAPNQPCLTIRSLTLQLTAEMYGLLLDLPHIALKYAYPVRKGVYEREKPRCHRMRLGLAGMPRLTELNLIFPVKTEELEKDYAEIVTAIGGLKGMVKFESNVTIRVDGTKLC